MEEILIVITGALVLISGQNDGFNTWLHDEQLRVSNYFTRTEHTFEECKTQCPTGADLVNLFNPSIISNKAPSGQVTVWGYCGDRKNCTQAIFASGMLLVQKTEMNCAQPQHCLCGKDDPPLASMTTAQTKSNPTTKPTRTNFTATTSSLTTHTTTPQYIMTRSATTTSSSTARSATTTLSSTKHTTIPEAVTTTPTTTTRPIQFASVYELQQQFTLPPNATPLLPSTKCDSIRCAALCGKTRECKSFTMSTKSHQCSLYSGKFSLSGGQQNDFEYFVKLDVKQWP